MIKDGGFDCVILGTPDQVHMEHSIAALEAGYHVICEKPLALTMEECEKIVEATKKSDKKFMTGQVCRKAPSFIKAKELVESGEIGELSQKIYDTVTGIQLGKIADPFGWRVVID